MAKSKSGGTRAYIRGKIGADVYSIGRDGKGAKQQVVRSLAEVVSNPQTENQMRGRMIMSTVMQAVSGLSFIIDHSFDNVPNGQPSISEFIRQNYALLKADVAAHPETGNEFGYNMYQEKGCHGGKYLVSFGKVPMPAALAVDPEDVKLAAELTIGAVGATYGKVKELLGLSSGDYITLIGISYQDSKALYARLYLKEGLADSTAVTAESVASLFDVDTNTSLNITFNEGKITFKSDDYIQSQGVILSRKGVNGWEHTTTKLTDIGAPNWTVREAMHTYPVGSQRFLNGGEL